MPHDEHPHEPGHHHGQAEPRAQEPMQEREYETGKDEAYWSAGYDQTRTWNANTKRTYDEYQNESLQAVRDERERKAELFNQRLSQRDQLFAKTMDAIGKDRHNFDVTAASVQKHVENIIEQLAVASDLATDRKWNVDEVAGLTSKTPVEIDAVIAALVDAVSARLAQKREES